MKNEYTFLNDWRVKFIKIIDKAHRFKKKKLQDETEIIFEEKKLQDEAKILIDTYYEEVDSFKNLSTLPKQISEIKYSFLFYMNI